MPLQPDVRLAWAYTRLARAAAVAVLLVGGLALAGWALDLDALKAVLPGGVAMNPATAVALMLAATGLWLLREAAPAGARLAARACGAGAALVGVVILARYVVGWDAGLDTLLFAGALDGNRMAPNSAALLVLLGAALGLLDVPVRGSHWPAQLLTLLALAGCLLVLIGYAFGVHAFYGVTSHIPMALNSAAAFAALALGLLFARPAYGVMALLASGGTGGALARRLTAAAVVVPWGLGWLRLRGEQAGLYETEVGVSLMAFATIALLLALVCSMTLSLERTDAERRRAEAELRRSAEQIRDLYDRAPCGYHSLGPDGTVLTMNRTELRWLGYAAEEVVGRRTFPEFLTEDSRRRFAELFPRFKERGEARDLEFEMVRRDGSVFPVLLNATAVRGDDGRYLASRSTVVDATERKRAEVAIRRINAELEERVRARTAELADANRDLVHKNAENEMFVYSVSHDLRSPLVNLQGFSKELDKAAQALAKLLADDGVPPAVREAADQVLQGKVARSIGFIQTAVLRLSAIIDALLRLSRAGRVEYRREQVDVARVVRRVVEALGSTIAERQARVVVGELPPVRGDATALEQLFANLVGNALTYLDPARPGLVEVGALPPAGDGQGVYYVRDNGLGIAGGHQARIFQAFQRAHPGVGKGEGLGLAIVARVAERHRGKVWVESMAGAGSTFFVSLPADTGERES